MAAARHRCRTGGRHRTPDRRLHRGPRAPARDALRDLAAYGQTHADEGLILYLEASDDGAYSIARALHGMRLSGWFDHARAVLIGRTHAPDAPGFTQRDAVADALGALDVPVLLDVECGHVPPRMPIVNGSLGHLVVDRRRRELTQTLARGRRRDADGQSLALPA